jgi:hypothetical protein
MQSDPLLPARRLPTARAHPPTAPTAHDEPCDEPRGGRGGRMSAPCRRRVAALALAFVLPLACSTAFAGADTESAASSATPADASAMSATSATPAASATSAAAPTLPPSAVGRLAPGQQVRWLQQAQQSGLLARLDDDTLVALFRSLAPDTLPRLIAQGPNGYPSYQFTMLRWERIKGKWPDKPDRMLVRLAHDPLRIYARWLPDGAHAGQEILYDEATRPDEMYGHLGGLLGFVPVWTSIHGALARAQSNHTVRDLGTGYIARRYLDEHEKYLHAGIARAAQIAVRTLDGVRVVAFTFDAPAGQPQFYARKETLGLDLRHPYFRTVESYGNDGQLFERIVFKTVTPMRFDAMAFDPKNPHYHF